jgi:hypothetical protein
MANHKQPEQVEVKCRIEAETPKAVLIITENRSIWIPISQVHYMKKNGDDSVIRITPWIAQKNGLA